MKKLRMVLILMAMLSAQAFADAADDSTNDKPCAPIVKACADAGFTRGENVDKKFWQECMKPTILGKSVTGVTVDAAVVKACRTFKVKQLKMELKEMQQSS